MFMMYALRFDILHQAQSQAESVPVRKLAEKFGHLPVKDYTPGEAEDNVADISSVVQFNYAVN